MTTLPPAIRRVVTGHDAQGKSCFVSDGPSPAQWLVPSRPGYRVTNLWRTEAGVHIHDEDDISAHQGVSPPAQGTVLRIIDWPAEPQRTPEEQRAILDQTFASLYPDAQRGANEDIDPSMHQTATIDYALVLEGEIVALMENGEKVLQAGDVLIQRGTNHGWANRSGKPARVAFILIDAQTKQGK